MQTPQTRYARVGDAHVAYQVVGDGPLELVYVRGPTSHLELIWDEPATARGLRRLASFSRLVLFDRRGTGLSDALDGPPTLERWMDDVRAVMRAAGLDRAALLGGSDFGLSALFAATYPEIVTALVLSGATAQGGAEGVTPDVRNAALDALEDGWGTGSLVALVAPSQVGNAEFCSWWARYQRASTSPGMLRALLESTMATDLRAILPTVRVPTLVLHRVGDALAPVAGGREVAALIPGARLVELPGTDAFPFADRPDEWLEAVEEFLTGARHAHETDRVLATVLFTDIVGSTERAARLGDRRWRELLDEHDAAVRHELARWRGHEVKPTGDGFLATFDGPARAVRCAAAVVDAAAGLGLQIRSGVHTGECERDEGDVRGIAVHIGARISALARPGEVLVSSTVKDLVVGSELRFADRGEHQLKGVPDRWRLYAVER